MSDNLRIWNSLSRTDPRHTKPFNRSGGFKGTAVKPIWVVKQLTEQFGPCGVGWGVNEPSFNVVQADGEILVFCTVSAWHGDRTNVLHGVGGDKVSAKRNSGSFNDDEAFKKAFTDAVNNAFKFIGVAADIHMGQFDDDKYVTAAREEFAQQDRASGARITDTEADAAIILRLCEAAGVAVQTVCESYNVSELHELSPVQAEKAKKRLNATIADNSKKAA